MYRLVNSYRKVMGLQHVKQATVDCSGAASCRAVKVAADDQLSRQRQQLIQQLAEFGAELPDGDTVLG